MYFLLKYCAWDMYFLSCEEIKTTTEDLVLDGVVVLN